MKNHLYTGISSNLRTQREAKSLLDKQGKRPGDCFPSFCKRGSTAHRSHDALAFQMWMAGKSCKTENESFLWNVNKIKPPQDSPCPWCHRTPPRDPHPKPIPSHFKKEVYGFPASKDTSWVNLRKARWDTYVARSIGYLKKPRAESLETWHSGAI